MLSTIIDGALHFDKYLSLLIQDYGTWSYLVLFFVIFAETGLVITPFLPGDSLLFTIGAFSAIGSLNIVWTAILLSVAAILGDGANYAIGKYFGEQILLGKLGKFIKREHIDKTHSFYEKYGSKTIVLARFVPIVRTFAPFVAGIGKMGYMKFATYNIVGCLLWINSILLAGYYFGNIRLVKENFTAVVLGIVFVSILPGIFEYLRHRSASKKIK